MIDDRTAHQQWPLPHRDNALETDVGRLRTTLQAIDQSAWLLDQQAQTLTQQTLALTTEVNDLAAQVELLQLSGEINGIDAGSFTGA